MRLYRFLLENKDNKLASLLLALLSRHMPQSDIQRLHEEIADPKYQIRKRVTKRNIKHLIHFTQAANVASILKHGLIPRQHLSAVLGHESERVRLNDRWRHDARLDASCLSISFPNYQMFFQYRKRSPDAVWAILRINSAVLWQLDCAYFITNAASKQMSNLPVEDLKTIAAFDALFKDYEQNSICIKRSDLRLADNLPTNPQAEVLVFDIIPPQLISSICLRGITDYSPHYHSTWQGIEVTVEPEYFDPRGNYKVWSTNRRVAPV